MNVISHMVTSTTFLTQMYCLRVQIMRSWCKIRQLIITAKHDVFMTDSCELNQTAEDICNKRCSWPNNVTTTIYNGLDEVDI